MKRVEAKPEINNPIAKEQSPDRTYLLVSFRDEEKLSLSGKFAEALVASGILYSFGKALTDQKITISRRKVILGTVGVLTAFASIGCNRGKPELTPTPVPTSTPEVPTPMPLPTLTPKPTETPCPKITPTPTAVVINLPPVVGGIEPRLTPTPDIQRENLAQKAADYYLKNPLIDTLNNRPLSGVVVSERGADGNLLISIRTLRGETLETSLLAGNWGYFALNEKNEVMGIVWAKQDTFKDSDGRLGYLGDSTLATTGAGWFGMEQMGYWTKDKKLIATVNPKTGEPVEKIIETAPIVKGLVFNAEDKKYYAEKGNPYGLKEGVYAGEKIIYNQGKDKGVVLTPEVVSVLMKGQNTPERIDKGEWQIPFPMDPRGKGVENVIIKEHKNMGYYFILDNLTEESSFISCFADVIGYYYRKDHVTLRVPTDIQKNLPENAGIGFYFSQAEVFLPIDGKEVTISFGQRLFYKVSGTRKDARANYGQVLITGASLTGNFSYGWSQILKIDNSPIFLMDKAKA